MRPVLGPVLRRTATLVAAPTTLLLTLALGLSLAAAAPASAANRTTPGDFTGYGFDQCSAPSQGSMDAWLQSSPYLAAGIYISGASRGCLSQPNLTPAWVTTQLADGWRLLPISLGPQASCSTKFPRYGNDPVIDDTPGAGNLYAGAATMGEVEANRSVRAAAALGLSRGSTLWYDIEAFDTRQVRCTESALRFLSSWVARVKALGFVTGVYSSGASGIAILDDARLAGRAFTYPDYLWVARWDGVATVSTPYITGTQWWPHRRVKQYVGGHVERYGGVSIDIDQDYLDVGLGSARPAKSPHCGGVRVSWRRYGRLYAGHARPRRVQTLQCLLKERGVYAGAIDGRWSAATLAAAQTWQRRTGASVTTTWVGDNWATLFSFGATPVLKIGSASDFVRRAQRALNATVPQKVLVNGIFGPLTTAQVRTYQARHGLPVSGVVNAITWAALQH